MLAEFFRIPDEISYLNMKPFYQSRIESIDFVRGLVMLIMALDHTRELFHTTSLSQSPTDLATTTPLLFFTRWITHLCAPTFVFLSGVSAYLSYTKKENFISSRKFLIKRGLWLIFLEITFINFGVWFDWHFQILMLQVIFAIGCGFIILGLMLQCPPKVFLIAGLTIIAFHNIYPMLPLPAESTSKQILDALFTVQFQPISSHTNLLLIYPPIPWTGIMFSGFGIAPFLLTTIRKRKSIYIISAQIGIILFLVLRFNNGYGDPTPWSDQNNMVYTVMAFVNLNKYPPSLMYTLLMLGLMFIILFLAEGKRGRYMQWITVYGKVPLFYYVLHWYVLHILLFILIFSERFSYSQLVFGFNLGRPEAFKGVPLAGVYLIWILVVALFYPICKWFSRYKASNMDKKWLRYL